MTPVRDATHLTITRREEPPVPALHPDVARDDRRARQLNRVDRSADVIAEMLLGPDLGARPACAGRSPDWDADVPGETVEQRDERHQRAVTVCIEACPAFTSCRRLLDDLDGTYIGVWGGTVRLAPTSTERRRQRQAAQAAAS